MEYSKLLCVRIFPLMLYGTIFKGNIRQAALYGNKLWCVKESEMGILPGIHDDSNVCSTAQR